jgi:U3 small nucleolar RNA-associated protein 12
MFAFSVKFSPDARLLAIALLDNTVKVFYADTLKFFLSLYGHKLPITSIDISSDSTLLVSAFVRRHFILIFCFFLQYGCLVFTPFNIFSFFSSADKNVKLWGLDFGDCHKSIFAHQDVITGVKFVGTTHHFFTVSKVRARRTCLGNVS